MCKTLLPGAVVPTSHSELSITARGPAHASPFWSLLILHVDGFRRGGQQWVPGTPVFPHAICWFPSQYTLEGKRGNPSVIFLMCQWEKLFPLRAHPSHDHSHPPDPSVQAQVLPSVPGFRNVSGDVGSLEFQNSASCPCCHLYLDLVGLLAVLPPGSVPSWPCQASMLRLPS